MNQVNRKSILVVTGIYPPDVGGPATHLSFVVPEFVREGSRVSVITFANEAGKEEGAVSVYKISRKQFVLFRALSYVVRVLREAGQHDVLYVHDINIGLFAAWLTRVFRGKRFVIRMGGDFLWERAFQKRQTDLSYEDFQNNEPFPYNVWRKVLCFSLRRAGAIIVQGEFLKRIVVSWGIREKDIHVVYNAVRTDVANESERHPLLEKIQQVKASGKRAVVASGRFVRGKHFDVAIEAMQQVEDAHLFVVGDGPEEKRYQSIISELHLQNKVTLHASVGGRAMRALLRKADCYLLPSETDTFSFMVIEALFSETPVLLYRVGALKELFGPYEGQGVSYIDALEGEAIAASLASEATYGRPTEDVEAALHNRFSFKQHFEAVRAIVLGSLEG